MAYTTINKSSDYFNTKLYTGNGSTNAITGVGFKPDFTWIKSRSVSRNHKLFDIVRGVTKVIGSNESDAESTVATSLTAFGSDGFTVSSDVSVNENSATLASWNWLAGGSQGSSNTAGSINTTYTSVNTTAGFSISSYTGTGSTATVGHGLGTTPSLIIVKSRTSAYNWSVYHSAVGATKYLRLNSNIAATTSSTRWNDTTPTSSVFTLGNAAEVNESGGNYIAYCFAEKTGYSKFGIFEGTGNATQSPFIFTGFKPSFILTKQSSASGEGWLMHDNKRLGYNPDNNSFYANGDNVEATGDYLDILSNGFKIRNTNSVINGSGSKYIYMAFGQSIVGSNNIPATAR